MTQEDAVSKSTTGLKAASNTTHMGQEPRATTWSPTQRQRAELLPGGAPPVGPGLLAEHLVALQTGLVGLAVGVAGPPHTHVLHQAQVGHLVAHQGVREDVGRLLVVGLHTPGAEWSNRGKGSGN